MGMFDLHSYPIDSSLWHLLAYTTGTGGSILIIGSAAGVAIMGMVKIDFFWYLKNVSLLALLGYFSGVAVYLLQSIIF
jgi:Na+/H+ antiporter NhaD/arsenite permease-like protein